MRLLVSFEGPFRFCKTRSTREPKTIHKANLASSDTSICFPIAAYFSGILLPHRVHPGSREPPNSTAPRIATLTGGKPLHAAPRLAHAPICPGCRVAPPASSGSRNPSPGPRRATRTGRTAPHGVPHPDRQRSVYATTLAPPSRPASARPAPVEPPCRNPSWSALFRPAVEPVEHLRSRPAYPPAPAAPYPVSRPIATLTAENPCEPLAPRPGIATASARPAPVEPPRRTAYRDPHRAEPRHAAPPWKPPRHIGPIDAASRAERCRATASSPKSQNTSSGFRMPFLLPGGSKQTCSMDFLCFPSRSSLMGFCHIFGLGLRFWLSGCPLVHRRCPRCFGIALFSSLVARV